MSTDVPAKALDVYSLIAIDGSSDMNISATSWQRTLHADPSLLREYFSVMLRCGSLKYCWLRSTPL